MSDSIKKKYNVIHVTHEGYQILVFVKDNGKEYFFSLRKEETEPAFFNGACEGNELEISWLDNEKGRPQAVFYRGTKVYPVRP